MKTELLNQKISIQEHQAIIDNLLREKEESQKEKVAKIEEEKELLKQKCNRLENQYHRLLEQFKLSRQRHYGRSTEKHLEQLSLFDEPGKTLSPEAKAESDDKLTVTYTRKRKNKPKRKALPEELPREDIVIDIDDKEKQCSCGCMLTEIGEVVSEQLEIIPAKLYVKRFHRKKYACRTCSDTIKVAKRPEVLLPKSMAGGSLIAHTIVSKYVDHLPLYRQEQIFKRHKIYIPRNSSCGWLMKTAEHCEPLYQCLRDNILAYDYVQADETPVQVHKEKNRKNTTKSYMWCYHGGPPDKPNIVFDYQPGRSGDFAREFLEGFEGYLQTDAYQGYNFAARDKHIIQVGCMIHARRPFADVIKITKEPGLAHEAIHFFKKLYHIETEAKDNALTFDERKALRLEKAKPLLDEFHRWLLSHTHKVPTAAKVGEGIHYCLNHWNKLTNYLLDGRLQLDNNAIENLIRPFAVGRRNWLFMGSPTGARAGAIFYSLIATARANHIDPYHYFRKLFKILPGYQGDYQQLLPQNIVIDY